MLPHRSKQQGLSLIELMIASALGIVLTGAAIQFMLSSSQTYNVSDDLSRVQENGRVAMDILARDIRRAGYQESLTGKKPYVILTDCNGAQTCALDGATNVSDTLSIQYGASSSLNTDCLGNPTGTTDIIANVYYIQETDGINSLYCRGYNVTSGALSAGQPLVDGIDNMQVLYRVQRGSTYVYMSRDRLTTDDLENITAIRVGLLASNGQATGRAPAEARSYQLLDSAAWTTDATDTQVRRIYTTTIQLNNRHAGVSG